jgi:hypothetical protein
VDGLRLLLVEQHRDERDDDDVPEQHEREPPLDAEEQRRQPRPGHRRGGDAAGVAAEPLAEGLVGHR